jgi:hypothetical protein
MESKEHKRESYRNHIKAWEISGQKQNEYCSLHGLNYQTFVYFRKHWNRTKTDSFKEIKLPVPQTSTACLYSIEFPNKCIVRVHEVVGAEFISGLVNSCK